MAFLPPVFPQLDGEILAQHPTLVPQALPVHGRLGPASGASQSQDMSSRMASTSKSSRAGESS